MANAIDKEQIDLLKNWWNDYGKTILIAVLVGLLVGFGWRYWTGHKKAKAQNASVLYSNMESALLAKDTNMVEKLNGMMQEKFSGTAYADMGSLITAKQEVESNELKAAFNNLNWVLQHGAKDEFKVLARVNMARILLEQKEPKKALDLLKVSDDSALAPLLERVKGDIYFSMGNQALAKQAYEKAAAGLTDLGLQDPYLTLLINQATDAHRQ